jgi:methyltransferase family protein
VGDQLVIIMVVATSGRQSQQLCVLPVKTLTRQRGNRMTAADPPPTKIDNLEWAVWPSFAMLAGIQLDLFTVLRDRPMTIGEIADAISVRPDKLKPLLYALAASRLLTVEGDFFANTSEANHFLVRGSPSYRGGKREVLSTNWKAGL